MHNSKTVIPRLAKFDNILYYYENTLCPTSNFAGWIDINRFKKGKYHQKEIL